jgi:hypothetical protein
MQRRTKKALVLTIGIPAIFLLLAAILLFVKIRFDFPANKRGYDDFVAATEVRISNRRVYVRYTGWEDTHTYFRFQATQKEIAEIVKSKGLHSANGFYERATFYWWSPQMMEGCQYFAEKQGLEWTWLYYNPGTGEAYYFASTF